MNLSAEITMYPLQDDYLPLISAFISKLNQYEDIQIQTFPTATIIMGEHQQVMALLTEAMAWSHEAQGKAVFVVKFLPGYTAL